MGKSFILACIIAGAALPVLSHAAAPISHFPKAGTGQFLADRFDLASIRSSFGPRRTPALRTFSSFGMKPSKVGDDVVEFEDSDWFYQMKITGRRDVNSDGIEDLEVCFTDQALRSSYSSMKSLLITRYSGDEAYAVALNFGVDACGKVEGS